MPVGDEVFQKTPNLMGPRGRIADCDLPHRDIEAAQHLNLDRGTVVVRYAFCHGCSLLMSTWKASAHHEEISRDSREYPSFSCINYNNFLQKLQLKLFFCSPVMYNKYHNNWKFVIF